MIGRTGQGSSSHCGLTTRPLAPTVDEQFHFVSVVVVAPQVYLLPVQPIPMRKQVKYGSTCPFALIHIIDILGESSKINDAKVARTRGKIIGSGLADIVPARPNELSCDVRRVFHRLPHGFMGARP